MYETGHDNFDQKGFALKELTIKLSTVLLQELRI